MNTLLNLFVIKSKHIANFCVSIFLIVSFTSHAQSSCELSVTYFLDCQNNTLDWEITGGISQMSYELYFDGTFVFENSTENTFTGLSISDLNYDNYQLIVYDQLGTCSASSEVNVQIDENYYAMDLSIATFDEICYGSNTGSAYGSVSGGIPPYEYTWYNNDSQISVSSNFIAESLEGGSYWVTVTDANNCSASSTFSIQEAAEIAITTDITTPLCGSNNGSIDVFAFGGVPDYYYSWSNGTIGSSLNNINGGQNYYVEVMDNNGCLLATSIYLPCQSAEPNCSYYDDGIDFEFTSELYYSNESCFAIYFTFSDSLLANYDLYAGYNYQTNQITLNSYQPLQNVTNEYLYMYCFDESESFDSIPISSFICNESFNCEFNSTLDLNSIIQATECNSDTVIFSLGNYIDLDTYYVSSQWINESNAFTWGQNGMFWFHPSSLIGDSDDSFFAEDALTFEIYDQNQSLCDADTINLNNVVCDYDINNCDFSLDLSIYNLECSFFEDDGMLTPNYGGINITNPNTTAIVEIINQGSQEEFGVELSNQESYYFSLLSGNYLLNAYFPEFGCFYTHEFSVLDNSMNVNFFTTPSSSINSQDGSISLNISSGTPNYSVSIYGPNGFSTSYNEIEGSLLVDNLIAGPYEFYITDSVGCLETFLVFINFMPNIFGCTDSLAVNYNPLADVDDGSCNYCQMTLVSTENTNCEVYGGFIEVSTNAIGYQYDLQILNDGNWISYNDGCFNNLNYGASWSCLPADTFLVVGYGPNNCVDTISNSNINLTELIENEQLEMITLPPLTDDAYSDVIAIGFPFTYDGVTYEECLISSNNYLSFNLNNAMSFSQWPINNAVPSEMIPTNAIMTPFQDLNPGIGGDIEYLTYGEAPNRVFIVRWKEIPMYSCVDELFSSTLYLFEGSNIIETHIENKPVCPTWNEGAAIHALHDANGTEADVVFDNNINMFRNYPNLWTTANDGYQFIPSQNGLDYQINNIEYGSQYQSDNYLSTIIEEEIGCTDPSALNYNPFAICDDNSCVYPLIYGCTDSSSYNYNSLADINDGSCCYQNPLTVVVNPGQNPLESSWNIVSLYDSVIYYAQDTLFYEELDSASMEFYCMNNGCYQLNMFNWIGGSIDLYFYDVLFISLEPAFGSDLTTLQFCLPINLEGCTDSLACNFNQYANIDDGSCSYPQFVNQEFLVCDGFELNDTYYEQPFTYIDTLINSSGCDSVVSTFYNIQYSPQADMFIDFISNLISVQTDLQPDLVSFLWNTNENTSSIYVDSNGVYSVVVTDTSNNCSTSSSINVNWLETSDILDNNDLIEIMTYPNPFSDETTLRFSNKYNNEVRVQLVDYRGRLMRSYDNIRADNLIIKKDDLSNGLYFINLIINERIYRSKIIIQ